MCCKKDDDSQCCMADHKEKIVPCVLIFITFVFTVAGFIVGHKCLGKHCSKKSDEF